MATKKKAASSGEVVAQAAAKSRDEYRASQPNLKTVAEADADAAKAAKDTAAVDLPSGQRRGHPQGDPRTAPEPYVTGDNPGAIAREKATGDLPTGERSHLGK